MTKWLRARLHGVGTLTLTVAVGIVLLTAAALAIVDPPASGTTAPGAHEFRALDGTASCSRCHGGAYPHYQHEGQTCAGCHGGGHVATRATCLDCHGGHDDPVPVGLCTQCHENSGGSLVEHPNQHQSKVDQSQCVLCHGDGPPGPSTTTLPTPSTTTAPVTPTTTDPSTTLPPSTTTTAPVTPTTTNPSTTTTSAPTATTTSSSTSTTTTTTVSTSQPPIADAGGSRTVAEAELVWFSGLASSDPDGQIVDYRWDFGDGSTAAGAALYHSYPTAGAYTVTLTVTDNDGLTDTDVITITVQAG